MTRLIAATFVLASLALGLPVPATAQNGRIGISVQNDSGFDRQFTVVDEYCNVSYELSLGPGRTSSLSICTSSNNTGRIRYMKHGASGWVGVSLVSPGQMIRM
jgi:hypothetical protein